MRNIKFYMENNCYFIVTQKTSQLKGERKYQKSYDRLLQNLFENLLRKTIKRGKNKSLFSNEKILIFYGGKLFNERRFHRRQVDPDQPDDCKVHELRLFGIEKEKQTGDIGFWKTE